MSNIEKLICCCQIGKLKEKRQIKIGKNLSQKKINNITVIDINNIKLQTIESKTD